MFILEVVLKRRFLILLYKRWHEPIPGNQMVKILKEEDIPEVVLIWNENSEYLTSDGKKHTIESLGGWYKGKHHENHELYSFFHEDEIIGFCITKEDVDISWIKMFALKKTARGKGFGSQCLKEVQDNLHQQIIRCEVKENNAIAISFFLRHGYKKIDFDDEYKEFILQRDIN